MNTPSIFTVSVFPSSEGWHWKVMREDRAIIASGIAGSPIAARMAALKVAIERQQMAALKVAIERQMPILH
jgi:hypothetical protein